MSVNARERVRLGARLRHEREAGRLSLEEVAQRSGMTKSFLSRVERDMTSPSIASLVGIGGGVGPSVAELFQFPQTTLARRRDRPFIHDLQAADVVDTLITQADEYHVTVLESAVPAGGAGGSGGSAHYTLSRECEVCFVLDATVELQVEDQTVELHAGDALTFGAVVPHTWRAPSNGARILWILAPGLPDPQRVAR